MRLRSAVYAPFQISKDEQINIRFPFTLLRGELGGKRGEGGCLAGTLVGARPEPGTRLAFGAVGRMRVLKE